MTPMQKACFTFPDRNALVRRMGRFNVQLAVNATPGRDEGSWFASVKRHDNAFVERWTRDDKVMAAQHLKRVVRGVGTGADKYARGEDFVGLERQLSADELKLMAPPLPADVKVENDTPELGALRRLLLWIAYAMARRALGKRQAPALPPASEEQT